MKTLTAVKVSFSIVILFAVINLNTVAQNQSIQPPEGIWLGKIEIPNAVKLRMAVIVKSDGSAALNIVDQATGNIPIDEVLYHNDTVCFKLKQLGIAITGIINPGKDSIISKFSQHGGEFALNMGLVNELPQLKRPQMPQEPFTYTSEEIEIENCEAQLKLQGTLTLPNSNSPVPAVVLLTGSGQQERDEEVGGHKPFWVIADHLTRNGIAVLRMDDRGIGGSTGDFNNSTTGDFAGDALKAIEYLKNRPEIDACRIGLIGHSEGGSTAVIAASRSNDVKFIVSLSGPLINFGDIQINQICDQLRMQNVSEENIKLEKEWREKINQIVREPGDSLETSNKMWSAWKQLSPEDIKIMNWPEGRMKYTVSQLLNPWWNYSIKLNVVPLYMKLDCPALLLFGEKDTQVSAKENMPVIAEAVQSSQKTNITIQLIEGVNHLFQTAETGSEYEYVQIEETISPKVLNLLSDWILNKTVVIN